MFNKADMKKRVFIQAYFHCNLGDDLFVKLLCERYPDVKFTLIAHKKSIKRLSGVDNLKIIRRTFWFRVWNKISQKVIGKTIGMNIASKSDCTVLIGGSMFMETDKPDWKSILKSYSDICGVSKHYFVIGANFGPYSSTEFYSEYRSFFEKTESVVFRDKWSAYLFSDLKQVSYAPDVVFNLSMPRTVKKKRISVSPIYIENRSELSGCDDYYRIMAEFCEQAVSCGYTVSMLSFCIEQHDDKACEKILSLVHSAVRDKIQHIVYSGNIESMLQIISSSEAIVASRFHANILGFLAGCKVYPVIYSIKTENVLKDINFKGCLNNIKNMQPFSLGDILNENNYCDISSFINNSNEQFLKLDNFLNYGG